jgi:hypothetical protein
MLFGITFVLSHQLKTVPAANKQLQRIVIPNRWRGNARPLNCGVSRQSKWSANERA